MQNRILEGYSKIEKPRSPDVRVESPVESTLPSYPASKPTEEALFQIEPRIEKHIRRPIASVFEWKQLMISWPLAIGVFGALNLTLSTREAGWVLLTPGFHGGPSQIPAWFLGALLFSSCLWAIHCVQLTRDRHASLSGQVHRRSSLASQMAFVGIVDLICGFGLWLALALVL
jgi:hypothetical protein